MRFTLLLVCLTGGVGVALSQPPSRSMTTEGDLEQTAYRQHFERGQKDLIATGASSCASDRCHAGATPRPGEVFLGIEYHRWHDRGRGVHFRAYKVLYDDDRSDRMAKLLYGPNAVAKSQTACRACHALDVEQPKLRGRAFDLEDGVSCEACHGRSEKWIGPHRFREKWRNGNTTQQRTALGFYDTRDLVRRAEKCLECHLGSEKKSFTHQILAAGHPPLTFELAGDLFNVPKHWNDEQCYLSADEGSWFHVRVWAVGQAVMLREQMRRLAEWAAGEDEVDYAFFECYSCHHELTAPNWRKGRGAGGRLGEPVWDAATWAMCRPLLKLRLPDKLEPMERKIAEITESLVIRGGNRAKVRAAAEMVAQWADHLAGMASSRKFTPEETRRMIQSLTDDRDRIAGLGYRAAVQACAAVYALYVLAVEEFGGASDNREALPTAYAELHKLLYDSEGKEQPNHYDPLKFASLLAKLEQQIGPVSDE